MLLREVKRSDLGSVKSVESLKNWSTFVGGKCDAEQVEARIEALKTEISQTDDIDECRLIQDRITRLASGVAIIRVGGVTEVDMVERKHRIEDALAAVKGAQQEGILPGGGIALLRASQDVEIDYENDDERFGASIILEACAEPIRKIAENCGEKPDVIIATLLDKSKCSGDWTGYNFHSGEYVNMAGEGIVDPAKVTRCALQNASSAASTLMTTNYAIVEI
jgi:chaperonin GroEL